MSPAPRKNTTDAAPENTTDAAPILSDAAKKLIADRDKLVAEHDAVTGNDQSAAGRRAGKVRAINEIQLTLTRMRVPFEKWTSPVAVRTSQGAGSDAASLLAEIADLASIVADAAMDDDIRATADKMRSRKVKTATGRDLMTDDGRLTDAGLKVASEYAGDAATVGGVSYADLLGGLATAETDAREKDAATATDAA